MALGDSLVFQYDGNGILNDVHRQHGLPLQVPDDPKANISAIQKEDIKTLGDFHVDGILPLAPLASSASGLWLYKPRQAHAGSAQCVVIQHYVRFRARFRPP
ncbi:unnamed protein product [Calypogeia fissa]